MKNGISRYLIILFAAIFIYHDGIWHAEPVGSGEPEQICYMEHEDTPEIFRIPAPHHHEASNEHGECNQRNHHNWFFTAVNLHIQPHFITLLPEFNLTQEKYRQTDYPAVVLPIYHAPPIRVSSGRGPPIFRV